MVVGREEEREFFERDNAGFWFWVCPVSCEREWERQELGKGKKILILGRLGRFGVKYGNLIVVKSNCKCK